MLSEWLRNWKSFIPFVPLISMHLLQMYTTKIWFFSLLIKLKCNQLTSAFSIRIFDSASWTCIDLQLCLALGNPISISISSEQTISFQLLDSSNVEILLIYCERGRFFSAFHFSFYLVVAYWVNVGSGRHLTSKWRSTKSRLTDTRTEEATIL